MCKYVIGSIIPSVSLVGPYGVSVLWRMSLIEVIARFSWVNLLEEEIVKCNILIFGTSLECQVSTQSQR